MFFPFWINDDDQTGPPWLLKPPQYLVCFVFPPFILIIIIINNTITVLLYEMCFSLTDSGHLSINSKISTPRLSTVEAVLPAFEYGRSTWPYLAFSAIEEWTYGMHLWRPKVNISWFSSSTTTVLQKTR